MMAQLESGQQAPSFTLTSDTNEQVTLSDLRGQPVILYFYPKAMTSGCTTQACAFRDAMPDLEAAGAVVLGISPDPIDKLVEFKEQEGLNFPLLSDPDHAVADAYGVWGEKQSYGRTYEGIIRSQFLVDAAGVIRDARYKISPTESVPAATQGLSTLE